MRSFKTIACVAAICAAAAFSASCNKDNGGDEGLSTAAFFSQDVFNYNLTQNPTITIPVVKTWKVRLTLRERDKHGRFPIQRPHFCHHR